MSTHAFLPNPWHPAQCDAKVDDDGQVRTCLEAPTHSVHAVSVKPTGDRLLVLEAAARATSIYLKAHAALAAAGVAPERPEAAVRLADAWLELNRTSADADAVLPPGAAMTPDTASSLLREARGVIDEVAPGYEVLLARIDAYLAAPEWQPPSEENARLVAAFEAEERACQLAADDVERLREALRRIAECDSCPGCTVVANRARALAPPSATPTDAHGDRNE